MRQTKVTRTAPPPMGKITMKKRGRPTTAQQQGALLQLQRFSSVLWALGEQSPERLTVAQLSFFLFAAMADKAGRPATFGEIREAIGGKVGRGLHTTYKVFIDGVRYSGVEKKGLHWLEAETDPKDNRRKLLVLTPKGRAIVDDILEGMSIGDVQ